MMHPPIQNRTFEKAEALWFTTDVVVLRAGTQIFRVFTAILKEKSSVFADMFSIPQPPPDDIETMDGVPVVDLYDEPAELEVFLTAIFDSSFLLQHKSAVDNPYHPIWILRLSHKYDVSFLRRWALEQLDTLYTTVLSEYEVIQYDVDVDISAIRVATEVGALWLLPMAYYAACTWEIRDMMTAKSWAALGESEKATCLGSHSSQMRSCRIMMEFFFLGTTEDSGCSSREKCNSGRRNSHRRFKWSALRLPLSVWAYPRQWKNMGLCEICLDEAKALHAASRQVVWDGIPGMFDLPGWTQLEEMRRIALE